MDFVTVSTGLILPYWMGLPIRYIQGSIRLFVLTEENYQKGENINDNYSFAELIQTTDYYIQIGDEIDYDEN